MTSIINSIQQAFSNLFYDANLVNNIKKSKVDQHELYLKLMSGRITMKEYLDAIETEQA